jgi:hypothetical protein
VKRYDYPRRHEAYERRHSPKRATIIQIAMENVIVSPPAASAEDGEAGELIDTDALISAWPRRDRRSTG